jgi:hypothetical protein
MVVWIIPTDIKLDETSIVYSAGVGEDISLDLLLSNKYNSNIILIDPTKKAKKHYKKWSLTDIYKFALFW